MKKTKKEMGDLIISLQSVFDIVKLINPTQLKPCIDNALKDSHKNKDYCFKSFQKDARCQNCISLETFTRKTDQVKIEFIDRDPYFVIAKYVEVDNYPYVLECAYKVNGQVGFGNLNQDYIQTLQESTNDKYIQYETGIYNKRYYLEQAKNIPCNGIAIITIDHLKSINQKFGRKIGDDTILFVAQVLKVRMHHNDIVCHLSSNELMLIFRETDELAFVEKLRDLQSICAAYRSDVYENLRITVSIGACFHEGIAGNILNSALEALYQAQNTGNSLIIN